MRQQHMVGDQGKTSSGKSYHPDSRKEKSADASHHPAGGRLVQSSTTDSLNFLWSRLALQPKLTIGPANDEYESEADAVADRVMRMPDHPGHAVQRQPMEEEEEMLQPKLMQDRAGSVRRLCPACEEELQRQPMEEEEEETLQAKADGNGELNSSAGLSGYLAGLSGGSPLGESERGFFEPRFGRDFSEVRLHSDVRADRAARSINAMAFTRGNDIVLRSDLHQPGSTGGRHLLAHELTHVVQQRGGTDTGLQRRPNGPGAASRPARRDCDINESNPVIWFDYNTTNIRTSGGVNSIVHLMAAIRRAQTHISAAGGGAVVYLYGYASEEGDEEYNRDLSQRRADTIRGLMEDAGIEPANLRSEGMGEDTSMAPLPMNRRVEICPTPTIDYIEMPEETITADAVDCDAPTKAANLTQYAFLIGCLERQLATTHGPVDILRTLRELYYGGDKFDNAACGERESGTIASLDRTAPDLMAALRASKVTSGVDMGHIFTGLEAMLCPRTSTSPVWYAPSVSMANEDFLTWGGDIGSAAAGRLRGYNDSGIIFKSDPPWSRYFLTTDTLASQEDLLGDIDAFTFRANQRGVACASTKGSRMPSPSTPISQLFLEFYSAPPGMATGMTAADRFTCFASAVGGIVAGTSITNKPSLVTSFWPQVLSFAHLFYLGMRKTHILTFDAGDLAKLMEYSRDITGRFFNWVESRL